MTMLGGLGTVFWARRGPLVVSLENYLAQLGFVGDCCAGRHLRRVCVLTFAAASSASLAACGGSPSDPPVRQSARVRALS